MNTDALLHQSILIITEYYNNNLQPFFDAVSEDILWIGPAQRQELRGKQQLIDAWSSESHNLTFTMGEIRAVCVCASSSVREIILHYDIYTHYPSGNTDIHDQRLHYTWRERRVKTDSGYERIQEIIMMHISNAWLYDIQDKIYPVHYENLSLPTRILARPESYLIFKSINRSMYRVAANNILYIEKVKASSHISVHTTLGVITANGKLQDIEQRCKDLIRIHAGHMVNPRYVTELRRFAVTMSDGREFPIPEKKYTKIKKLLTENEEL